jgi:hypothetical protein
MWGVTTMRNLIWLVFLLSLTCLAEEPKYIAPLSGGSTPECPEHTGSRTYRSELGQTHQTTVLVTSTTTRAGSKCNSEAEIRITVTDSTTVVKLDNASAHNFSIIDFSPDGSQLLLSSEDRSEEAYQHRDVRLAIMQLRTRKINWRNAWDLFGWKDCDAMVEPQGFMPDGRVAVRVRKSVIAAQPHPNCVNDVGLYAANPELTTTTRLADSREVKRYGKKLKPAFQACSSDPDIIGSCFKVHGRIAAYNGTPTFRIWRTGTDRLLGVDDDFPLPEGLSRQLDWDVNAFADFEVCPLTREQKGEMQRVCVESAEHIVVRTR